MLERSFWVNSIPHTYRIAACLSDGHVVCCRRRQIGFYGWFPPQRRTEAEVMRMDNVTLLNMILAVAGLVFAAYIAGTQNRR